MAWSFPLSHLPWDSPTGSHPDGREATSNGARSCQAWGSTWRGSPAEFWQDTERPSGRPSTIHCRGGEGRRGGGKVHSSFGHCVVGSRSCWTCGTQSSAGGQEASERLDFLLRIPPPLFALTLRVELGGPQAIGGL